MDDYTSGEHLFDVETLVLELHHIYREFLINIDEGDSVNPIKIPCSSLFTRWFNQLWLQDDYAQQF